MKESALTRVKSILPEPFDWAYIPTGQVRMIPDDYSKRYGYLKETRSFDVPAFYMAKYPVTNAQFRCFVESSGYQQESYWLKEGWERKLSSQWAEPRYPKLDIRFDDAMQPVTCISWFEAMAFCYWLSEISGAKIMLPTDEAWQRAAQGDDERLYPWGNDFDTKKANIYDSRIRTTSLVTAYPDGASPFGVMDMFGNVWEWCLTSYVTGTTELVAIDRVLRGSSFLLSSNDNGLASRNHTSPSTWYVSYGFRICALIDRAS